MNDVNRRLELKILEMQNQQNKTLTMPIGNENASSSRTDKQSKPSTSNGSSLRDQLALKEEQCQDLIRALADIRRDMVRIADGNLKALNEDDQKRFRSHLNI